MTITTRSQRLLRLVNTVRHLKIRQIVYQLWYRLHTRTLPAIPSVTRRALITHKPFITKPNSWEPNEAFTFLNERREYSGGVKWQDDSAEKLWLYNLHYFDYLQAVDGDRTSPALCNPLINDWIESNTDTTKDGWEPYPTSLRIVNWVKYDLNNHCLNDKALESLAQQAKWLAGGLEYHILANHLFANIKALIFAGVFFEGYEADRWLAKGLTLMREQLREQVLADGGHYERSPMYHAILLEDVLDLINVAIASNEAIPKRTVDEWISVADRMGDWHQQMVHPDGDITFFNDAAFSIAPTSVLLNAYCVRFGLKRDLPDYSPEMDGARLAATGFAVVRQGDFSVYVNLAPIAPSYQPGHAHADTLSCELSVGLERVLVNSGTSTYVKGELRNRQRSTAYHNTIEINGQNSSDTWDGFRVGRRAEIGEIQWSSDATSNELSASHNGYRHLQGSPIHHRLWRLTDEGLVVEDTIEGEFSSAIGRWFLHPAIEVQGARLTLPSGLQLAWSVEAAEAQIRAAKWYPQFGMSIESHCIEFYMDRSETRSAVFRLTRA